MGRKSTPTASIYMNFVNKQWCDILVAICDKLSAKGDILGALDDYPLQATPFSLQGVTIFCMKCQSQCMTLYLV
jgi:hypothetical protein